MVPEDLHDDSLTPFQRAFLHGWNRRWARDRNEQWIREWKAQQRLSNE
jgi:hypothetical protein